MEVEALEQEVEVLLAGEETLDQSDNLTQSKEEGIA
jgi:hypothetical protein